MAIYRPPDLNLDCFLSSVTGLLDYYSKTYEDFIVLGDFNEQEQSPKIASFLNEHCCINIVKKKTCFKSVEGSCIDLILTSRPKLHQLTEVYETGMSDHHLMIYTMLKSTYTKAEPKILRKRSFKYFSDESFLQDLNHGLNDDGNFSSFNNDFKQIVNYHAPIKEILIRGNTKPHLN